MRVCIRLEGVPKLVSKCGSCSLTGKTGCFAFYATDALGRNRGMAEAGSEDIKVKHHQ